MAQVFISYRQTDDDQRKRVRAFAERLRDAGIDVILDQFFLDANPGGPNEGWDKWSSDRALQTEYVIIIGTKDWFECFEKNQPAGTGYGAACEADDIRSRIYKSAGVIKTIRVVFFDDEAVTRIPSKLDRYHRFHAERDFTNVARWLKGNVETGDTPRTSIPHNLPSLQPFFGREDELRRIADALDPESRTWGALIDGPGGMGKTSLAVRAAYDVSPDTFERIVFISLKSRELDDDGVRDLSGFLISGLAELLNELSRELAHSEITKAPEEERPRLLLNALRGTKTLLILDNLESLLKKDRDVVFTLVKKLPAGCKAILTSRGRIGSGAEELILEKLSEEAALATLAKLAENNPALGKTTEAERIDLYHETGGKPLLLRWTAGQIGRGSCLTLADAITYLRTCPNGNDPLEFIFGDLVEGFSEFETRVLCALTYFTLPATLENITELSDCSEIESDNALRSVINRSLVIPSVEFKTFALVPLVADFLRKKKPEVVLQTGGRLEKRAYALVIENGGLNYERFPVLDAAWPTVAAAFGRLIVGPNDRLQKVCESLFYPCLFSGRYDELVALNIDAENHARSEDDFLAAGWRAYHAGFVYCRRRQTTEALACAVRADAHWSKAPTGPSEQGLSVRLRGMIHELEKDYPAAIDAYSRALEILRTYHREGIGVLVTLQDLGTAKQKSGDLEGAERDYRESLRLAVAVSYKEGVAGVTASLAGLALERKEWLSAEELSRKALFVSEEIGSLERIGRDCHNLAEALVRQGKKAEARPYIQRAIEILRRLNLPQLASAEEILAECES